MINLFLFLLLVALSSAQSPERVGDIFPIQFRSNGISDITATETPLGKSYILIHPGATYIALHFSSLHLQKDDTIEVSDANGEQAYTLTGRGKGNGSAFWSQHVKGDTIVLNMVSSTARSFFVVDEYAAGFESFFEAICLADDKVNAVCYASTFPTAYSKSKAVARLLINGNSLCTGFLVSETNHFLTNNHCIPNATYALNTDYEFMSEAPSCSDTNSQLAYRGSITRGATFIQTSISLDYTLVRITNGNPASLYGFLELDDQLATIGSQIYIPQHPGGKAKQLAIYSTDAADASDGFCHINNSGNFGICSGGENINLMYGCDTEGGSSGSPIISMLTNKVVGLHKCGRCPDGNAGTSAHIIRKEVASLLVAPTPAPVQPPAPPSPVAPPVEPPVPTATVSGSAPVTPTCLSPNARCTSASQCCGGVCRNNGRCR